MKHSTRRILAAALLSAVAGVVAAQPANQPAPVQATAGGRTMSEMADAEVRRVDNAAGKVTLRHGDLKELEMPPMTMVFEVRDKAMLDGVKAGDKVKFKATYESGKLIVIEMKPAS